MTVVRSFAVAALASLLVVVPAVGCGDDEGGVDFQMEGSQAADLLPEVVEGEVSVRQVRVSEGLAVAAGYLRIMAGPGGDRLVSASSPAAGSVVLHRMEADGSMEVIESLEVPDDAELPLEPGGMHLMLDDLVAELNPGDTVELQLEFEVAGTVTVEAPVVSYAAVLAPLAEID